MRLCVVAQPEAAHEAEDSENNNNGSGSNSNGSGSTQDKMDESEDGKPKAQTAREQKGQPQSGKTEKPSDGTADTDARRSTVRCAAVLSIAFIAECAQRPKKTAMADDFINVRPCLPCFAFSDCSYSLMRWKSGTATMRWIRYLAQMQCARCVCHELIAGDFCACSLVARLQSTTPSWSM